MVTGIDTSDFAFSYQHVAFKNAGHRPASPSRADDTFANGGTEQGNIEAHERTKVLVKDFFDKALR